MNPVTQQSLPPPVWSNLQFELDVPPLYPCIVEPVHASISACPAGELFLTVVPNLDITTVGPPGPEEVSALLNKVP